MPDIASIRTGMVEWLKDTFLVHKKPETLGQHIKNITALAGMALFVLLISSTPSERLSPNELQYKQRFGPGFLRFDPKSSKEKILILSAKEDWNGALSAKKEQNIALMNHLHGHYDVSFRTISHPFHICQRIYNAEVPPDAVIIQAHANNELLALSSQFKFSTKTELPSYCFSNLKEKAIISLNSCSAGAGEGSIAQHLANIADRPVIGATSNVYLDDVTWDDRSKTLFHVDEETDSLLSRIFKKDTSPEVYPSPGQYWERLNFGLFGDIKSYNKTG